jgi:hypothetical protein
MCLLHNPLIQLLHNPRHMSRTHACGSHHAWISPMCFDLCRNCVSGLCNNHFPIYNCCLKYTITNLYFMWTISLSLSLSLSLVCPSLEPAIYRCVSLIWVFLILVSLIFSFQAITNHLGFMALSLMVLWFCDLPAHRPRHHHHCNHNLVAS